MKGHGLPCLIACCAVTHERVEVARPVLTVRVTEPIGAGPLLGVVAVPATETSVPAGAGDGVGVAVKVGTYGCAEH